MTEGLYARPATLAAEYEISEATVSRLKKLIESHPERYASDAVVTFGGAVRIRRAVFHDAIQNRDRIIRGLAGEPDGNLKKALFREEGQWLTE